MSETPPGVNEAASVFGKDEPWPEDEPSIFDEDLSEEQERQQDLQAFEDLRAGRVISHAAMARWLRSWGTEGELKPPEPGE